MSPKRDENNPTYRTVQGRYGEWRDNNPPEASDSALGWPEGGLPIPELSEATGRKVFSALGVVIGLGLLALAALAATTAGHWGAIGRDGAEVGYGLSFFFLLVAGIGCISATLNHNFRVVGRRPAHH